MLPAIVQGLDSTEGMQRFLASVPAKIENALDRPPVSELIRAGAKKESLEACLALQIVKTSDMLTVGGNLRQGHALEIAVGLIADYPNESLEDFCLCLRRGAKGLYGDIFRFDIAVINTWMKAYLEDKYQVLEDELMKEKENNKDQYVWKGVSDDKIRQHLREWHAQVMDAKIETKASQDRRRGTGYRDTNTPEYYALRDKIRRTASEFYKDRYSFSGMQVWKVGEFEVFAESEADAKQIIKLAGA